MRVFSGIQPTNVAHIGNYVGAIQPWIRLSRRDNADGQNIFCIADLHGWTGGQVQRGDGILAMAKLLMACGLPLDDAAGKRTSAILFRQSEVPLHTLLAWRFACTIPPSAVEGLSQYRAKRTRDSSLGLLTYPVLQAADILLYRTEVVPVGEDQRQHIELTREIARRINHSLGRDFFPLPQALHRTHHWDIFLT